MMNRSGLVTLIEQRCRNRYERALTAYELDLIRVAVDVVVDEFEGMERLQEQAANPLQVKGVWTP